MRETIVGTLSGLLVLIGLAVGHAQDAPKAPALSADEQVMVESVQHLRAMANAACQELDAFKAYNDTVQKVSQRIEANHPGFSMNWTTLVLVAKPPAAKP